jgi:hypothetical protein
MNTAIPNPSKTITLNYSAETIKEVVKNLHLYLKSNGKDGYTKESEDEILSRYKFAKGEFLSLGSYINIMIDGDETKSTVTIDITRKMGAYDDWVEVSNANRQMSEVLDAISYGLNPNTDKDKVFTESVIVPVNESSDGLVVGFIAFMALLLYICI